MKAVHSPHTGIIDYKLVTQSYGDTFEKHGGTVYTDFPVSKFTMAAESQSGSQEGLKYPITVTGVQKKVRSFNSLAYDSISKIPLVLFCYLQH